MKILMLFIFLFLGCSMQSNNQESISRDEFDKILMVMKTKDVKSLYSHFGEPDEVKESQSMKHTDILSYKRKDDRSSIEAYIDRAENKITQITVFYWKDFDNYIALKK